MAELVRLTEDGPLGSAGDQVWVNDPADAGATAPSPKPSKSAAKK